MSDEESDWVESASLQQSLKYGGKRDLIAGGDKCLQGVLFITDMSVRSCRLQAPILWKK